MIYVSKFPPYEMPDAQNDYLTWEMVIVVGVRAVAVQP